MEVGRQALRQARLPACPDRKGRKVWARKQKCYVVKKGRGLYHRDGRPGGRTDDPGVHLKFISARLQTGQRGLM